MRSSRLLWRTTGLIGLVTTVVLVIGFIQAFRVIMYPVGESLPDAVPKAEPTDPALDKAKVQILAIGDSLTKGLGDENGEGYVGKVKKQLADSLKKPVYVWNFAVNGSKTQQLLDELQTTSMKENIKKADIILLSIGGNDLNQYFTSSLNGEGTTAGANGELSGISFVEVRKHLPEAAAKLKQILLTISEMNPSAKIVYIGLYHPYLDLDPKREGSAIIEEWNHQAAIIANLTPNVSVVPTFDIFQYHLNELLFSDHFHPNGAGYALMADRVMQDLR